MKIYLDIFFAINMGMNLVILLAESFFQNQKTRLVRMIVVSFFAAGMACLTVIAGVHRNKIIFVLYYFGISVLILRLAFGKTTAGTAIRNLLFYYMLSFVLGGLLIQMQNLLSFPFTGMAVLGVAGIFLLIIRWWLPRFRKWQSDAETYYRIRLFYKGRKVSGNALWDTGNHLRDPFTGEPVMLGESRFLTQLWKTEMPVQRMIPFHSVGKKTGMLYAFQADYVEIKMENGWCRVNNPWVAICDYYLSSDGEYELILHPEMLQKE